MNEFYLKLDGQTTSGKQYLLTTTASFNQENRTQAHVRGAWEISESLFLQTKEIYERLENKHPRTRLPDWTILKKYGANLFDALFPSESTTKSLWQLSKSAGEFRFVLECTPDEIANIPWELAFDLSNGVFISLQCHFLRAINRCVSVEKESLNNIPRNILILTSNPRKDLQIESEIQTCSQYWDEIFTEKWILRDSSIQEVVTAMNDKEPSFFHYAGHSGFNTAQDNGYIVLPSGNLDDDEIANLLKYANTHTAFFNSCWSGQFQGFSLIKSVAESGIPNVLAMNQPVLDNAAIEFSAAFYHGLASGDSLEQSLTDARQITFMQFQEPSLNWGLPTAIFHTPDLSLKSTARKEIKDSPIETAG